MEAEELINEGLRKYSTDWSRSQSFLLQDTPAETSWSKDKAHFVFPGPWKTDVCFYIDLNTGEAFKVDEQTDNLTEDEIVSTIFKRGLIIGVKKDGSTCLLGENGQCEKQ